MGLLAQGEDYERFVAEGKIGYQGVDDLPGTLAQITDDAPVILMAHEPDMLPKVPERVALTVSGHTHGGQVRLFGYSPDRSITVQKPLCLRPRRGAGGGASSFRVVLAVRLSPLRFGIPPEIVVVDLGSNDIA